MPALYVGQTGWQSREMRIIVPLAPCVLSHQLTTLLIMAAKKTAKKTVEPAIPLPAGDAAPAAKKAAKKATKKAAPAKPVAEKSPAPKSPAPKISADAIRHSAYLNYRRRVEQGLPGDSHGDWLEAERQHAIGKA